LSGLSGSRSDGVVTGSNVRFLVVEGIDTRGIEFENAVESGASAVARSAGWSSRSRRRSSNGAGRRSSGFGGVRDSSVGGEQFDDEIDVGG